MDVVVSELGVDGVIDVLLVVSFESGPVYVCLAFRPWS